jgi:TolA-binding protein
VKKFLSCVMLSCTALFANVVVSTAFAQPAKAAPATQAAAAAPVEGTTREDIVKSQLKVQTESTKKIAQMSERLEQAKTIQSMNQSQLESLKKQLQTDLDKANKILLAAAPTRESDKIMNDLCVGLEGWVKISTKSLATVTKLFDARVTASAKKPA